MKTQYEDYCVKYNEAVEPWQQLSGGLRSRSLPGPVAQLGERYNRTVEVRSSNLLRSICNVDFLHVTIKDRKAMNRSSRVITQLPSYLITGN